MTRSTVSLEPSGFADDSAPILAALAELASGGVLDLSPGVYRLAFPIGPDLPDGLTIAGYGATLRMVADVPAVLANKGGENPRETRALRLLGLTVRCDGHGVANCGMVQLNNCPGFTGSDLSVLGPAPDKTDGIAGSQGSWGTLTNCLVDDIPKGQYYASTACGRWRLVGCVARNARGPTGGVGFEMIDGGADLVACEAVDCLTAGVLLTVIGPSGRYAAAPSRGVSIQGGRFARCGHGIFAASAYPGLHPGGLAMSGTILEDNLHHGVLLEDVVGASLSGLHCSRNGYHGVALGDRAAEVSVSWGVYRENGQDPGWAPRTGAGIWIAGARSVEVWGGRHFDDQPRPTQGYGVLLDRGANGWVPRDVAIHWPGAGSGIAAVSSLVDVEAGPWSWRQAGDGQPRERAPTGSVCQVGPKQWRKAGSGFKGWAVERSGP